MCPHRLQQCSQSHTYIVVFCEVDHVDALLGLLQQLPQWLSDGLGGDLGVDYAGCGVLVLPSLRHLLPPLLHLHQPGEEVASQQLLLGAPQDGGCKHDHVGEVR